MKILLTTILAIFLIQIQVSVAQSSSHGEIKGPFTWKSNIYPETQRQYWIYVPSQYDATRAACLMVVQDGLSRATGWHLPQILDSLIDLKKIPPMIGLFVDHGTVTPVMEKAYPRYNRSFEYDAMGDRYARFLVEELLPELQRSYNISSDPNDRSIAGASSGAICAFNVAWERPDKFRRVLSTIGTYVGLRGADEFVTLVRKTESKPLRVYLEDGNQDLNIYAGDWWMSNQSMLSALTYAGYEVNHAWGTGGHDSKHAITILADALVWLWKDYPTPVDTHKGVSARINLLLENEAWHEVGLNGINASKLAVNNHGDIFFAAGQNIYKIGEDNNVKMQLKLKSNGDAIAATADDMLYVSLPQQRKIISIHPSGKVADEIADCSAAYLCASTKGLYFTETVKDRIGFYDFKTRKITYHNILRPTSLAISAEKTFLHVGNDNTRFGHSFRINNDGLLDAGQEYVYYHESYDQKKQGQGGMSVDAENLLYTATGSGLQVADQLGRVNFIFSGLPKIIDDAKLAGSELNMLYVTSNGKLFRRKISAKGTTPFGAPVSPPKPGL